MTSHPIVEFGYAVRQARLELEMSLTDAAAEILGNSDRKGYVSQIEKGTRNLSPETIDKFAKYLGLDADIVKAAHQAPPLPKSEVVTKKGKPALEAKPEDQVDFDAERLLSKARKDDGSPQMGETLMIALAYEFAGGQYRDLQTAYIALRSALEAAGRLRARGDLKGSNAASHLDLVLADVAKLNEELRFEDADALFEAEEKRMREAHAATEELQAEEARQLINQRLDQDRIRNRPDLAAQRLIADLDSKAHPEGLFLARDNFCFEWRNTADASGDMFGLRVALEIAKANYEKAKGKRALLAQSLFPLGYSHLRIAERSVNSRNFAIARTAFEAALNKTSKSKDPANWTTYHAAFGEVLREIGEREKDDALLRAAVEAHQTSLRIRQKTKSEYLSDSWESLGLALSALGEQTSDVDILQRAVAALENAINLQDKESDPLEWGMLLSNLGLAQRRLGAASGDLEILRVARRSFAACEGIVFRKKAGFDWAMLQWNIADLGWRGFN